MGLQELPQRCGTKLALAPTHCYPILGYQAGLRQGQGKALGLYTEGVEEGGLSPSFGPSAAAQGALLLLLSLRSFASTSPDLHAQGCCWGRASVLPSLGHCTRYGYLSPTHCWWGEARLNLAFGDQCKAAAQWAWGTQTIVPVPVGQAGLPCTGQPCSHGN